MRWVDDDDDDDDRIAPEMSSQTREILIKIEFSKFSVYSIL